jgi:hypothetical protein
MKYFSSFFICMYSCRPSPRTWYCMSQSIRLTGGWGKFQFVYNIFQTFLPQIYVQRFTPNKCLQAYVNLRVMRSLTSSELTHTNKSRKMLVALSIINFIASFSTYKNVTTDKWTVTNNAKLDSQVLWQVKPCRMIEDCLILKRALRLSETLASIYQLIRRNIPGDWDLHPRIYNLAWRR